MSTCVYTANMGDYDVVRQQEAQDVECDWLCFTDGIDLAPEPWRMVHVEPRADTPMLEAKWWKLHPPVGYDHAIWIDANMQVTNRHFVQEAVRALGDATFAVYAHPRRFNIYDEIEACCDRELQPGKYDLDRLRAQGAAYRARGFSGTPLYAGGVIVWTPEAWPIGKRWWDEIMEWTPQDQLSLPYACWMEQLHPAVFPHPQLPRRFNIRQGYFTNNWLRIWTHRVPD